MMTLTIMANDTHLVMLSISYTQHMGLISTLSIDGTQNNILLRVAFVL